MAEQLYLTEYEAFEKKFERKRTTDSCYTPENVFEAVKAWVCARYGIRDEEIVRPFWPDSDYERETYPAGCCVLDNPPFSIVSKIAAFYNARGIRFFLFCPGMSCFGVLRDSRNCAIPVAVAITYANGAKVPTSFITNMERELMAFNAPDLFQTVEKANAVNEKVGKKVVDKLTFPDEILTAAKMHWMAAHGTEFAVRKDEGAFYSRMDCGREIFGGGIFLAERAAAERAAAERAAATQLHLSEREKAWQKYIGKK